MNKVDELIEKLAAHIEELIEKGATHEYEIAEKTKALAELIHARANICE